MSSRGTVSLLSRKANSPEGLENRSKTLHNYLALIVDINDSKV